MANCKKFNELVYLVNRAMSGCHYVRAEKLFRRLLEEAFQSQDLHIIAEVSKAFIACRRLHVLDACNILKRIDPIQSKQKELS